MEAQKNKFHVRRLHMKLSAPSKTFLIGEYLATQGGTAIIALTSPHFDLEVHPGNGEVTGITNTSPAGKFLARHKNDFDKYRLNFLDPHLGTGGLGASSAQYSLVLYFWLSVIKGRKDISRQAFDLLDEYMTDSWSGIGTKPSGADMLAQIVGEISVVTPSTKNIYTLKWLFSDLSFSLFRTGRKVATHLHLQNVNLIPKGILQEIVDVTVKALQDKNESVFLAGIKSYGETLAQFGFLDKESEKAIKLIYSWPEALAVKGCGAMGADILMIVHRKKNSVRIREKSKKLGLSFVANEENLSPGIHLKPEKIKEVFG
ncbi:MAG: hypothetical protein A4S09_07000 [Proteobacteria bacterium SG_bin7]|nr:MAG: hypothetical protein A4S09_07000 [Proteobacteria bacterium SG_bin7]